MNIDRILIRGERIMLAADASTDSLEFESSFLVGAAVRDKSEAHEVPLGADSVLELRFEDDVVWYASRSSLDELFPGLQISRAGEPPELPLFLEDPDPDRGGGGVFLRSIAFFRKRPVVQEVVTRLATDLELKVLGMQPGLYRVDENFDFHVAAPVSTSDPYLLFLHGTASATQKSFGGLKGSNTWSYIQGTYPNRVLALQHASLTRSPLGNVRDLVNALPDSCTLNVVTQSRGGLVGELLARFCNAGPVAGFTQEEIDSLGAEGRDQDVEDILAIQQIVQVKQIRIDRFIRVACPGAGTTLASKRLDFVLNMLLSLIGVAVGGNPVFLAFKALIGAVVDCKNDPEVLPGLEAMSRQSPFIKVLNFPGSTVEIDNSLAIIAGNCKTKLDKRALLVIASKLFFLHRNDLIVDTKSMYVRTRRKGRVQFFFHEGTDIDHFKYFSNKLTIDALDSALKAANGDLVKDFIELTGDALPDAQYRGIFGIEHGEEFRDEADGDRPILVIMPGIMGSNIKKSNHLIWINYLRFLSGGLKQMSIGTAGITASSLVATSYRKLADHFSSTYDIVTWPYDWRMQLVARAELFKNKIEALLGLGQPVKIIAHSMGGVLFRDFILEYPDTWKKLNESRDFRLVWLGAPLGGSFRIPAVLFGQDAVINKLSKIDLVNSKKDLLKIFSKLPGLLSLLPHAKAQDLADPQTWEEMRSAFGDGGWPLPDPNDLLQFGSHRDNVLAKEGSIDFTHIAYIAGQDKSTPCGYNIEETSEGKQLVFLSTAEGDASVTWDSGIPARMVEDNSVYYTDVTHGALANEPKLFPGITDLLTLGVTNLLSRTRPSVRSEEKVFPLPLIEDFDLTDEGVERTLLGLGEGSEASQSLPPLVATVAKGDLKFASYPVFAGHFREDGILYAESSIDRYLDKELTRRHRLGQYPGPIGTSEVVNGNAYFKGTVIVGLGDPGDLTAFLLMETVERGVTNYLLSLDKSTASDDVGITSLAIASGYGGITIEDSVRAIVQGVCSANDKLRKVDGESAVLVRNIEFIEQYEDRALSCFYAIRKLEAERNADAGIMIGRRTLLTRPGYRARMPVDVTQGWWTRITARLIDAQKVSARPAETDKPEISFVVKEISFSISTGGAHEDETRLKASMATIDGMIRDIGLNNRWNAPQATALFNFLIPSEFKERVRRQNNINWILDTGTAALPWELLQDTVNGKPLCINAGMIRQLVARAGAPKALPAGGRNALVVADPVLGGFLPQLPGARKEGELVTTLLTGAGYDCRDAEIGTTHGQIITKLGSGAYKIVHLAGHGIFDKSNPEGSGMVTAYGEVISSREISQMPATPELVIVNCCHLGRVESFEEQYYQDRHRIAANIGVQLIKNGVKAVIAAGWAIHDEAALEFTRVFYKSMFEGYSFGDAVLHARRSVYQKFGAYNTWGAYQCYGDPFYRLDPAGGSAKKQYSFVIPQEADVTLCNLRNDIEAMSMASKDFADRLESITKAIDRDAVRTTEVAEVEALAYADLDDNSTALAKFELLVGNGNLKAGLVFASEEHCEVISIHSAWSGRSKKSENKNDIKVLDGCIKYVMDLMQVNETIRRCLLLGRLYERKALLLSSRKDKIAAYTSAAYFFQYATTFEKSTFSTFALAYWLEVEAVLTSIGQRRWGSVVRTQQGSYKLPPSISDALAMLDEADAIAEDTTRVDVDYWNILAPLTIGLSRHMLEPRNIQMKLKDLFKQYKNLWLRVGSPAQKVAVVEHAYVLWDMVRLSKRKGAREMSKSLDSFITALGKLPR
jgi:hypothetical protein